MRTPRFWITVRGMIAAALSFSAILGCGGDSHPETIPAEASEALDHATRFELLSIDPARGKGKPDEGVHGWHVLGRVRLDGPTNREQVVAALRKGVAENLGEAASCFAPRHGIALSHDGKDVDLVICFECLNIRLYIDGTSGRAFHTMQSPQATFDEVLRSRGVPLPAPPRR